jgi:beta-phosphoglucomutase family hydrolase
VTLHSSPSLPFQAVIFDMDGVLVDSEPIYFEIEKKSFLHYGVELSEEDQHSFVGVTQEEMWKQVKSRFGLEPMMEDLLDYHRNQVMEVISSYTDLEPIPQAQQFIQRLAEKGVPIAVASSSSLKLIETMLMKISLNSYFPVVVSGEEVKRGKPSPDVFLLAAKRLGVDPSLCLVIEDSYHGVTAAKAAGMWCAAFRNLNSGHQDLSAADWIVSEYDSLWEL